MTQRYTIRRNRRELTPAERAMNIALLGDPDPERKKIAEQIRAQMEREHEALIEEWRAKNNKRRVKDNHV